MAKNLYKVQKKISKKRGKLGTLHENSRDSKRLQAAGAREDKLSRVAAVTNKARLGYADRVLFLQECTKDATEPVSDDEIVEFINSYINRDTPELEQLQQERRKGRPMSKREEALTQRIETEQKEFSSGFWMPDISVEDGIKKLRLWNGNWSGLSVMPYIRFMSSGVKKQSSFPPNGLS